MLHALLIAINEYAPGSGVRNLSGCLNDLAAVESFLRHHYAHLQPNIRKLTNAEATRAGVIKAFRAHLTGPQIKNGDQVLFYYSGHGSYGPTAPEFAYNDPLKQDETMVCYDSRLPGKQDLSDKERGALLAEVPKGAEVLFIIDSCHAASSVRNRVLESELGASRFQPGQTTPRTLDSYLLAEGENIYLQQKKQGQRISVPTRAYTLLAACDRFELAMETKDQRGLFTRTLLDILKNAGMEYTYAELMTRVKALLKNTNAAQAPQLENFQTNQNQVFLSKEIRPTLARNQITFQKNQWQVNCGAIHGLPKDAAGMAKVKVAVFNPDKNHQEADFRVGVKAVFATYSILDTDLPQKDFYWAAVDFASSLPIQVETDGQGAIALQRFIDYAKNKNIGRNWEPSSDQQAPKYQLQVKNGIGKIFRLTDAQPLFEPSEDLEKTNSYLNRIARWEQLCGLQNPDSKIQNGLEVQFCEEPKDNSAPLPYAEKKLTFILPQDASGASETLWYHLRARNRSQQPLHVAMLYIGPDYTVQVHYMRRILPPQSDWIKLDELNRELELSGQRSHSTERFLVLYSTEYFEELQYEEPNNRDLIRRNLATDDWATQLVEVVLKG
ncbi:caspase family protein [Haliscomenobacter sp.]|uniref:caspase family protein n=1 Tax=Haliscomenobacter sp. TaxID=2717303 RepID=UPI003364E1BA